jgi:hypothetical protein
LPPEFHTSKSFDQGISILKNDLGNLDVMGGSIDAPLLYLGLMYREVSRAMEVEPDAPTNVPESLVNSPFGIKEVKKIETLLKSVNLPSKKLGA